MKLCRACRGEGTNGDTQCSPCQGSGEQLTFELTKREIAELEHDKGDYDA